jgi:hypothetical protein
MTHSLFTVLIVVLVSGATWGCADQTLPPMPEDAPQQDEVMISGESDPVAAKCADIVGRVLRDTGETTLRVVVTISPQWGTVWRADSSFPSDNTEPPMLWRTVCWKGGGLMRPLEMFDPSKSIPRLS